MANILPPVPAATANMNEHFEYFGFTSPIRNKAQRPFLISDLLPKKEVLDSIIKELWAKPNWEFQYFG